MNPNVDLCAGRNWLDEVRLEPVDGIWYTSLLRAGEHHQTQYSPFLRLYGTMANGSPKGLRGGM